jgi:hypothetical protein
VIIHGDKYELNIWAGDCSFDPYIPKKPLWDQERIEDRVEIKMNRLLDICNETATKLQRNRYLISTTWNKSQWMK